MARLPGADRAVVPRSKLCDYVLSPEHPKGQNKARVFRSALGIDRSDWEYLRDRIIEGVRTASVGEVTSTLYGFRYSVSFLIEGLNGQTHEIATAWIVDKGDEG